LLSFLHRGPSEGEDEKEGAAKTSAVSYKNMDKMISQMRSWSDDLEEENKFVSNFVDGTVTLNDKYAEYLGHTFDGFTALAKMHHEKLVPLVGEHVLEGGVEVKKSFKGGLEYPDVLWMRFHVPFTDDLEKKSKTVQDVQQQLKTVEEFAKAKIDADWVAGSKTCLQLGSNEKATRGQLQDQVTAWAKDFAAHANKQKLGVDLATWAPVDFGAKVVIRCFRDGAAAKEAQCTDENVFNIDPNRKIFFPQPIALDVYSGEVPKESPGGALPDRVKKTIPDPAEPPQQVKKTIPDPAEPPQQASFGMGGGKKQVKNKRRRGPAVVRRGAALVTKPKQDEKRAKFVKAGKWKQLVENHVRGKNP